MATVQAIYRLAGRQTQGFLQSVFELMKLDLTVPDHSTLSRRRRQLTITLPVKDWTKSRRWWWTRLASKSTAKVNGKSVSTGSGSAGPGANSTSARMKRRSKSSASWPAQTMSATPKSCQIYSRTCPERSNKSAPMVPTISEDAMTRSIAIEREWRSCPAKEPGFGATPTAKRSVTSATRTCVGSEKSGARSGSGRATIIVGAWRRRPSSASRSSSAIGCNSPD